MTDLSKLVRPLVWQGGFAETPFGTLSVDIRSDSSWRGGKEYRAGDYVQNAQADEEADYTAKLLAAIDTDAVTALVDAANVAIDVMDHVDGANDCTRDIQALEDALARIKGAAK